MQTCPLEMHGESEQKRLVTSGNIYEIGFVRPRRRGRFPPRRRVRNGGVRPIRKSK